MNPDGAVITVLLAEDHLMIRSALRSLVNAEPDLCVVAECGRGDEAVALVASRQPDVAVLDLEMPVLDGLAACEAIVQSHSSCRCLALTALNKPGGLQRALRAGACGYIVKHAPAEELLRAIRSVAAGQRVVDASLAVAALEVQNALVTQRELDVVRLLAEGTSDREIARRLHLSHGTVRNYVSNVMAKVGARNRVDLVRIGVEYGWLWPRT